MDKNKMLIDATHPEETRVVAVRNGRVEEFDFESAARKLLRGSIYLAKVTRVEPSLQAAFIDYGGNRHGFLAFNEIHPDYYQIPVADRELLKQEEAEAEQRAEAEVEERVRSRNPRRRRKGRNDRGGRNDALPAQRDDHDQPSDIETFEDGYQTSGPSIDDDVETPEPPTQAHRHAATSEDVLREDAPAFARDDTWASAPRETPAPSVHGDDAAPVAPADEQSLLPPLPTPSLSAIEPEERTGPVAPPIAYPKGSARPVEIQVDDRDEPPYAELPDAELPAVLATHPDDIDDDADDADDEAADNGADDETIEQVANEDDVLEEVPERPRRRARQYKIQEVIKRRQIMLVQVVKEERGNKGAALTTYISLAGRYTVLMPNTARGGGISRKITQPQDRKRLKAIAEELDVPEGMGLIIRTAGAARTKQEIKRDYEYLLRLWESVRDLTLSSTAPCLVYEEGNIIKRAIRDLYSKDFDQIVVAGDGAHRDAQDFMEMLMPGSGSHVASYRAPEPLFARYGVERQLNALFSPYVTLRSGGYIVINQTEALVSVDVNSGKSTREFSIEETALNTNLEAAEEIARQLKLRDLAGLIVVDFIDMEEKRNNRSVERRLKDALRHDRARIQVGRISHFGLLEMSRQRLRAGILEGSTSQCPHCQGTGIIRSIESVALAVLRGIEDQLLKQPSSLVATATAEVALYILNHKRAYITEMEHRHGVIIRVEASDRMQGASFGVERIATPATVKPVARAAVSMEWGFDRDESADDADEIASEPANGDEPRDEAPAAAQGDDAASDDERRGRRRRRRRGRRDRETETRDDNASVENAANGASNEFHSGDDEFIEAPASDLEQNGTEADDATEASDREHRDEDAGGEPRRRGRRRGRRGGRARRREGEGETTTAASLDDADRHEWGVAEFARPGAEQPSAEGEGEAVTRSLHLVRSVEIDATEGQRHESARATIVESLESAADGSSYAYSSTEAVRLAVNLAGDPVGDDQAPTEATATPAVDTDTFDTTANSAAESREPISEPTGTGFASPSESLPPQAVVEETLDAQPSAPTVIDESPVDLPAADETPVAESAPATVHPAESIDHVDPMTEPAPAAAPSFEPVTASETEPSREPVEAFQPDAAPEPVHAAANDESAAAPRGNGHAEADVGHHAEPHVELETPDAGNAMQPEPVAAALDPSRPARRGWWQRRFGSAE